MYISVSDAAKKFNISKRRVQILCEQGRIEGANMVSGVWLIPDDARKPADRRRKRPVTDDELPSSGNHGKSDSKRLTMEEVCDLLSISSATAKNWVRLGKLRMDSDSGTFSKAYIEHLLAEIKNGSSLLKSRRNKKNVSGKALYKDYITNGNNHETIGKILDSYEHISEAELRIILAHFAIQLYRQCGGKVSSDRKWMQRQTPVSDNSVFNALISDLLNNINIGSINLCRISPVFDYQIQFVSSEDTLGFIYLSLRDLGHRKQTGAYYTPAGTVNMLIDSLSACLDFKDQTICDPCCGTGNFLIGLLGKGVNASNLYGQDIDEISILLTRINVFLLNQDLSKEQLDTQFVCGNTLEDTFSKTFSIVLGNPPWGYTFSKEETAYLIKHYRTAKQKGSESYDLFIEKGLSLLTENGYLAYIVPKAVLSVNSHLRARELMRSSTSFKFVSYLGNVFSGVQCPAIILGLQKDGQGQTKQCRVLFENKEFTISKNREINASEFSFHMNDDEYDCLYAIDSVPDARYLACNAKFALGIVTGNNKKYIRDKKEDGFETVLKGSDIFRYSIKDINNYIQFTPNAFQQVASEEMYRAEEKLLYRFICEVPVFAYDNCQTLSLNSCNILIPQIEGMDIKYVLAVLNSRVSAFFINKKFNSVKLLRSHIESMPIPAISAERQRKIVKKTDHILNSSEDICGLYEELDNDIMEIFCLSQKHRDTIRAALSGKNLFLPDKQIL